MTTEEAIEILSDVGDINRCAEDAEALEMAIEALEQEPKTGHWILLDECSNSGYYCSECHKKVIKEGWSKTVKKVKYCPNCGAKMAESEDKE